MVCQDAFVLSHTMMLTDLPGQEAVDAFLPVLDLKHRLGDRPRTVGGLDFPHETEIHRRQLIEAMKAVPAVYRECQQAFERAFGRRPADPVVPYRIEDADCVIVSMGTTATTVRTAVDAARERGIRAGALRVRMFRPFPEADLRRHLAGRKRVAVLDRDLCPGLGGILWAEVRGCAAPGALVQGTMLGLGGGDIRPEHVAAVIDDLVARSDAAEPRLLEVES
jgi:pyruvate/2-oxoacid:ferredoxin oxidoreductase alpha subunit